VPSGYWKVVATQGSEGPQMAAFIFGQDTARSASICDHLKTVDELEARSSGLNLFHGMDEAAEKVLKTESGALARLLGCGE
jgi:DNA/RNA endonuclease G (NUC1)